MVTPACDHDSQALDTLIDKDDTGQPLYGDGAYIRQEAIIHECGMINEKGAKGKPLTEQQKASN
jgi:hypothetical protein